MFSFVSRGKLQYFLFHFQDCLLFGKLSEKLYILSCAKNTLILLSELFPFSGMSSPFMKKNELKSSSKTQKSHQSQETQASHSPVLPLTSGCGSGQSEQRQKPLGTQPTFA